MTARAARVQAAMSSPRALVPFVDLTTMDETPDLTVVAEPSALEAARQRQRAADIARRVAQAEASRAVDDEEREAPGASRVEQQIEEIFNEQQAADIQLGARMAEYIRLVEKNRPGMGPGTTDLVEDMVRMSRRGQYTQAYATQAALMSTLQLGLGYPVNVDYVGPHERRNERLLVLKRN